MRRIIITTLFSALLAVGWQEAKGFSLLGPRTDTAGLPATYGDTWQTPVIGYDILANDVGTPKNFNQGYRWNTPVLFYGFDATFSGAPGDEGFFGLDGEQAVINAFTILNNTFTNNSIGNLNGYSTNLVEFPFNSQLYNNTALSLGLTDVKSIVLAYMVEELGLAEPERWTWTLHDRQGTPIPCPAGEEYLVTMRNYYYNPSPLTNTVYSPYVNDTLYTYQIEEACTGPNPLAIAAPIPVDPDFYGQFNAVADNGGESLGLGQLLTVPGTIWESANVGGFYVGLTADDVGGLRYLMSTNQVVYEDPDAESQLEVTNFTLTPLITTPLGPLLQFAVTNPPAAVLAFAAAQGNPNLVIDSVSNYYTLVTNWTIGSYFTNRNGDQSGTAPTFVIVSNNPTFGYQTNWVYTFGNMVIFSYSSNTPAQLVTTTLGNQTGQQFPEPLTTNVTSQTIILNQPSGQYYVLPTNSCGFDLVITDKFNVFAGSFTNSIISATNTTATGTGFIGTQAIVELLTNSLFRVYSCSFTTSGPDYYQGISKMQFVRIPDNDIDPLRLTLRTPITNTYSMTWWDSTNYHFGTRVFQRVLIQPDILFHAQDLTSPNAPVAPPIIGAASLVRSIPNWDLGTILPNQAGPGVINPPIQITLNNVGNIYGNGSLAETVIAQNGFLDQTTQVGLLQWASFDATTNPPILYPNGTSIQNLENQLVLTIIPSTLPNGAASITALPNGTNNFSYGPIYFGAQGGNPPYTWTNSAPLPANLSFFNGVLSGTLSGNAVDPLQGFGTYDIPIEVTDSSGRTVFVSYPINIYDPTTP